MTNNVQFPRPEPLWLDGYPPAARYTLRMAGLDPKSDPRAHEYNLRLVEFNVVLGKVAWDSARFARWYFNGTVDEVYSRVWADDGHLARPVEEIEVLPDWVKNYPPEYARLLSEHGVPTVPGSVVDDFNRRLIQLVGPDCADEDAIQEATRKAALNVGRVHIPEDEGGPPDSEE